MKLQTQIPLHKESESIQIDYDSKLLLFGSCFSENIGVKFNHFKFQNNVNPFGILFHPKAIETFIDRILKKEKYSPDEFIFNNEQHHCLDAHSSLSSASKSVLQKKLNEKIDTTHQQIQEATHIIITLGTAWVYTYLKNKKTVANCHKLPQKEFKKTILSVEEITKSLTKINQNILRINSKVKIIYTISPVRHLKDGYIENQRSKSHLISAIHQLDNKQSYYFPSYEIMMDELRDYRFYDTDMIHPNPIAIEYIWEKFNHVWLHQNTKETMQEVATIQNGLAHKPFNVNSDAHQKFIYNLKLKKEKLMTKFPKIQF